MAKYKGDEAEMYEHICQKYAVAPAEPFRPTSQAVGGGSSSSTARQGFARKAGAAQPPPEPIYEGTGAKSRGAPPAAGGCAAARSLDGDRIGPPPAKKAPAMSSLMARFQNLFGEGEDEGGGDAQRGSRRSPSRCHGDRRADDAAGYGGSAPSASSAGGGYRRDDARYGERGASGGGQRGHHGGDRGDHRGSNRRSPERTGARRDEARDRDRGDRGDRRIDEWGGGRDGDVRRAPRSSGGAGARSRSRDRRSGGGGGGYAAPSRRSA
eukprot:TRINITY_DN47_c0_g1_i3.p1 TRINITY_DN47_c0_g1~~TRINITY_DN47_c0_g1_i3.p1  ORF type:complete len:267 (-),score=53.55 TRINITY_DN47_c0_g1_i3:9-809(-)